MTDLEVIDTHVHAGPPAYASVEAFIADMDRLGMRRAVLVQHFGQHDDTYLAAALRRYAGRFALIGSADPDDPAMVERLEPHLRASGAQGIRLPAGSRSPGRDPEAIWQRADELGLIVSVRGPFADIIDPGFKAIVASCQRIRFRFEHIGWIKADDPIATTANIDRFLRLADHQNTAVQLSGFYLNSATTYPYPSSRALVRAALDAFGPARTMWSGDWNRPDLTLDAYGREIDLLESSFGIVDPAARAMILGGTARAWFDFDRQPDAPEAGTA